MHTAILCIGLVILLLASPTGIAFEIPEEGIEFDVIWPEFSEPKSYDIFMRLQDNSVSFYLRL